MKKIELLQRIEALEAIVKPIAELQRAEKNAKELEEKKDLEGGKWYIIDCADYSSSSKINAIIFCTEEERSYGFNYEGEFTNDFNIVNTIENRIREATPQEVEDALIKEAKKRGFKVGATDNNSILYGFKVGNYTYTNDLVFHFCSANNLLEIIIDSSSRREIFKKGKWAEVVEEKQYNPKIGDVVKAWNDDVNTFFVGTLVDFDEDVHSHYYYKVRMQAKESYTNIWHAKKVEKISKEEAIRLFFDESDN